MAISFQMAKNKLVDIFGEEETEEFLKDVSSKKVIAEDLISVVLVMYSALGPPLTHQIFDALGLDVANVEDRIANKGAKQLAGFRSDLWKYKFSADSPLSRIELGTNHIVLYPIPTELGRRLLACLVATMWNPKNLDYFDVYGSLTHPILRDDVDPTVSFILDHAGYKYSNPEFNTGNDPRNAEHLHPVSSGGYHTHIYYHWDFPGLLALQSILHFVYRFIDESDREAKQKFELEIINCIKTYSQHIADTLLLLLPNVVYEFDRPILIKVAKLKAILTAIQINGIYDAGLESMDLVDFTKQDYKECSSLMELKGNDAMSMLSIFMFDLKTYKENRSQLKIENVDSSRTLILPNEAPTANQLFKLACCLNRDSKIEALSQKALMDMLITLQHSEKPEDQIAVNLVKQELRMRDLRNIAGIANYNDLVTARCSLDYDPNVDKAMVGFRERVSDVADISFKFKTDALTHSPAVSIVERDDTKKALAKAGLSTEKSEHSLHDEMAANLYIKPAIIVRPKEEHTDPGYFSDTTPEYCSNIDDVLRHQDSPIDFEEIASPNLLAVFKPGSVINLSYILHQLEIIEPHYISKTHPAPDETPLEYTIVSANWFDAKTRPVSALPDEKTLEHVAVFQVSSNINELKLPVHNAGKVSQAFLKHFGVSLIAIDRDIPYGDDQPVDLICAEYNFKENPIPTDVLQAEGVFINTHPLRQFFTPLDRTNNGEIILGKKREDGDFEFITLEIPFGYSLVIEPNVIYGATRLKGHYAVALAEGIRSESVLMRTQSGETLSVSTVDDQKEDLSATKSEKPNIKAAYNPQRFFIPTDSSIDVGSNDIIRKPGTLKNP